jgi:hypothetical protein
MCLSAGLHIGSSVVIYSYICFLIQIGKSFVVSKLKDYPQFRSVSIAIQKSGFKVSIVNISYKVFKLIFIFFMFMLIFYCSTCLHLFYCFGIPCYNSMLKIFSQWHIF